MKKSVWAKSTNCKGTIKNGCFHGHKPVRDNCVICPSKHSVNSERFHGEGSFCRTHKSKRVKKWCG